MKLKGDILAGSGSEGLAKGTQDQPGHLALLRLVLRQLEGLGLDRLDLEIMIKQHNCRIQGSRSNTILRKGFVHKLDIAHQLSTALQNPFRTRARDAPQNDVPPPNLNSCTTSYLPLVSGTA